ncbi:DUF2931 family protein [Pedobacter nototheniae]|uniref:DUF2931 family protein n=1 Tax=Pedobacter nototheniae TaxID=2488994 RepID=UPI00292D4E85|nr:DUF2931 family protein [Pedobacter nototheniae]
MFKERENIINVVLAAILILIITANIVKMKNYRAGDRFEWSSGVYSMPGNTVQVAKCTFSYADHWNYSINNDKILNNGRDDINYTEKGLEKAFYPDSLDISWYSYTERKFYGGNFLLPYRLINDLARQLRNTTKSYNIDYARANPDKVRLQFLAEVLPNGKLTVWLSDLDKYIEIGKYQAKQINKTWEIFNSSYGNSETNKKINIASQTSLVMDEYAYSIEIQLPDLLSLRTLSVNPYNQTSWKLDKESPQPIPVFKHIPKDIMFTWGTSKKEYWTQWSFKDEEILSAFKKLQSLPGNNKTILLIKVNDKNDKVTTSLKKGSTIIALQCAYDDPKIYEREPQKEDD